MRGTPWTPDEVAALMQAIDVDKLTRPQAAERIGRSLDSCNTKYHYEREKASRRQMRAAANADAGMSAPSIPSLRRTARAWTEADLAEMIRLREMEKLSWTVIDRRLDRCRGASLTKYAGLRRPQTVTLGVSVSGSTGGQVKVAASAAAARAESARLMPATLTAAVFGDPLPGRSALDRRVAVQSSITLPAAP